MNTSYIGTRDCGLLHIAERPVEDVLAGHFRIRNTVNGIAYSVKQHSIRYRTFDRLLVCSSAIVGSRMFPDTHKAI